MNINKKMKDFLNNEVVHESKIQREKGYLYYIDKVGDISRVRFERKQPALYNTCKDIPKEENKPEKVLKLKLKRDPNYLYYIDKNGNISRCRKAASGRKPKARRKL